MVVRFPALGTGRHYHLEMILVNNLVRGTVDHMVIMRLEGLCQWKITMTPSRIEPATFRFVVVTIFKSTLKKEPPCCTEVRAGIYHTTPRYIFPFSNLFLNNKFLFFFFLLFPLHHSFFNDTTVQCVTWSIYWTSPSQLCFLDSFTSF